MRPDRDHPFSSISPWPPEIIEGFCLELKRLLKSEQLNERLVARKHGLLSHTLHFLVTQVVSCPVT
jgi:hypothetical protein